MTKVDMKYTSLFWKLGYIEERTDFYHKSYPGGYRIEIEAEKQEIDYGTNVDPAEPAPSRLIEHKDFVILECMNRLLEKGYARERIRIIGDAEKRSSCDIIVSDGRQDPLLAFDCVQWGRPFEDAMECLIENRLPSIGRARASGSRYLCLYTSRLDGGLLDYRSVLLPFTRGGRDATPYFTGVFEDGIGAYLPMPSFSL
ncbi:MAG: hypothetical protein JW839_05850, partial [Candidatus Lokiarchaeota archaeon]|nr:hypothetical protein [Candidatus Lokiarchaeota archaeon]